jgi:CO/xanthine dehydrogenase Mo-binding subunit
LDEKGEITVATAMVDQGAGTYTAMRQVAAETLQVPLSRVRVEILDTSRVGPDTGVGASRSTRIFGNATHAAALRVKESLLDAASEIFGVAKERLALTGDGAIRADASRGIAYGEIVEKMGPPIHHQGSYKNFDAGPEAAMCVQVAEVEVDSETGQVSLKQFTTAHSTGTVINPLMHQGQIDGGVVMGTGYALMEGITIEAGRVVTTHFGENKIPTIRDIPLLKTVVLEEPVGNGPFGAMSIGEPPLVPVAAAIANAVHDAIGVRIYDLPITAEKVFEVLVAVSSGNFKGSSVS